MCHHQFRPTRVGGGASAIAPPLVVRRVPGSLPIPTNLEDQPVRTCTQERDGHMALLLPCARCTASSLIFFCANSILFDSFSEMGMHGPST
jgi:hypothetical protein